MPLPPGGFPPTGPPFGKYPLAPAALIVTEGFRVWSPKLEVKVAALLPLATIGAPTAGIAGGIAALPFTDDMDSGSTFCAETGPPAAGAAAVDSERGENGFLVALA